MKSNSVKGRNLKMYSHPVQKFLRNFERFLARQPSNRTSNLDYNDIQSRHGDGKLSFI